MMLTLCAVGSACQYRVERDPQVMVRYFGSDPSSLNPIIATDAYENVANQFVMETLLERDNATMALRPKLAQAWESAPDHLEYRFHLRPDVHWHDGVPLTAADVVYSFDRINDPEVGAGHLRSYFLKAGIIAADAINAQTVRFRLERPYFLALETIGWMPIVARHVFDDGTPFRTHPAGRVPIGTGPMRFREWKAGRYLALERNPHYWGRPMALRGMTFKVIPDQGVAFQAMKKGEIDYTGIRPIQWARQTASPGFLARFVKMKYLPDSAGYFYIGWNLTHPILGDQQVRQALTMLLPRQSILAALLFDRGAMTTGPFYPRGPQYDPAIPPWPYDPAAAGERLAAAGWSDHDGDGIRDKGGRPFAITIVYPGPSRFYDALANIVREDFRQAGIAVTAQLMEWTVFLKTVNDKKYDAYFGGWAGGGYEMDPHQIWHSSQIEQGSNYVGFVNAEADALIDRARQEFDPGRRNAMYHRLHQIIHEVQPYTFLYVLEALAVRHHRFTNVMLYPNGPDLAEWGVGSSGPLLQ